MRLILSILCLFCYVSGQKVDFQKEFRISKDTMALLKKSLGGIDMEKRILNFRILESLSKVEKLTKEQENELKKLVDKFKMTVIEKSPEVNETDIVEINEQSGIANFLYQGDINLTEEQLKRLIKSASKTPKTAGSRGKRNVAVRSKDKWPNGIVYYHFDANVTSNQKKVDAIKAALKYLQKRTCIRFLHNNTATNRILFTHGVGCHSMIGMIGYEQIISIGTGCNPLGNVAHEVMHALGFDHMFSRPDRDQYITINPNVIQSGRRHDFVQVPASDSSLYTPYEYGGVMQYRANEGVIDKKTMLSMIPTDPAFLYTMGNVWVTLYDLESINALYKCSVKCPSTTAPKCQNGGLPNPYDCKKCNCPLGYGGALCDRMPQPSGGCGEELTAGPDWTTKSFALGENNNIIRDVFTECHHWIKAPVNYKIMVRITSMKNPQCGYGCPYNGIEFKLQDQQMTNPKICCYTFLNVTYTSELNPLPVIAHNRFEITNFTIQYKRDGPVAAIPQPITRH